MAKESLRDAVIAEIPQDEKVLKEGVLNTLMILSGKRRRFAYKYVLTDKGVWMRSAKFLWIKPKVTFIAYTDLDYYKRTSLLGANTLMFFPKNGKRPANHILFDDLPGATEVLNRYIRLSEGQ